MSRVASLDQGRLARFVVVGAGANIALFVLAYLFRQIGMPAFAAGVCAYAIAFAAAYSAQRSWTFGSMQSHRRVFPRYLATQVFCATLSGTVGHVGAGTFQLSPLWMSAAITVAAGVSSYLLSSLWVFAEGGETALESSPVGRLPGSDPVSRPGSASR